jgi:hypothetical protein
MGGVSGASSAAAVRARGFAGILSSESAGVMAVMRQNSKWALVPGGYGYGDDDAPDDPLLAGLDPHPPSPFPLWPPAASSPCTHCQQRSGALERRIAPPLRCESRPLPTLCFFSRFYE